MRGATPGLTLFLWNHFSFSLRTALSVVDVISTLIRYSFHSAEVSKLYALQCRKCVMRQCWRNTNDARAT
jgi:hypothetical protein